MQDDGGGGGGAPDGAAPAPSGRPRVARPAVQIYRPGMMKQGTDITLQARKEDENSPRDPPASHRRPPRGPGGGYDRGERVTNRRRSSPDSVSGRSNVSSIRDSGSTTPEAGTPTRSGGGRGGHRKYSGERTFSRGGGGASHYGGYRNGESRESSIRGSTDDVRSTGTYNSTQSLLNPRRQGGYLDYRSSQGGGGGGGNNRQRRYGGGPGYNNEYGPDSDERRRAGGYQQSGGGGGPPRLPSLMGQPINRNQRFDRRSGERASMRAEEGNRRAPRRRNDSIGSTQSEMPRGVMNGRSGGGGGGYRQGNPDSATQSCAASEVGDYAASNFTDDASYNWDAQSTVTSLADFASSFASLADMDWSKEVERDYLEKQNQEIQNRLAEVAEQEGRDEEEEVEKEEEEEQYEERPRYQQQRPRASPRRSDNQHNARGGDRSSFTVRVGANGRRAVGNGGRFTSDYRDEEEEDVQDGQRTPTNGQPRHKSSKEEDARAWIQGIGAELAAAATGSSSSTAAAAPPIGGRLAGRITRDPQPDAAATADEPQQQRRSDRRPERGSYVPRGMRGSNPSLSSLRSDGPNRVRTNEPTGEDTVAVHRIDPHQSVEREEKEGSGGMTVQEKKAIKQIEDELRGVLDSLSRRRDIGKAREMLLLSSRLSGYHASILTRDVQETYRNHVESSMFRSAFYQPITVLKSCSNSSSVESKECRKMLMRLINDGIDFYGRVIASYAESLGMVLADRLPWPEGVCPSALEEAVNKESAVRRDETGGMFKSSIGSLSRHLVSLGDLQRYRSTVAGDDDYSAAYKCYLQAASLLPSSGHTYNQLAILSFYQMLYRSTRRARLTPLAVISNIRQERVLNELFYLVRAASATHPYDSARERMSQRLAAARKKGEKYETLLDKEHGSLMSGEDQLRSAERLREYWIDVVEEGKPGSAAVEDKEEEMPFAETETSQLHRRTVSYIAYVHALLVCKIGMERFQSAAARMFAQLRELLQRPDCPMSAAQLVQVAALGVYAVHCSSGAAAPAGADVAPHTRIAARTLLTLLAVLLERVRAELPALARAVESGGAAPAIATRVLPAVHALAEWLASSVGVAHCAGAERLQPLELALAPKGAEGVWATLAEVANALEGMEMAGVLRDVVENDGASDLSSRVVLPESLLLASFTSAFPAPPKHYSFVEPPESTTVAALHVRLRGLLELARFLDGTDACAIAYSMERRRFEATDAFENNNEDEEEKEIRKRRKSEKEEMDRSISPEPLSDSLRRPIVVCPKFVVIDTNMYVDDLSDVKRILDSGKYQILVPTTVIDELIGLSQGRDSVGSHREEHAAKITEAAKEALTWLRDQAAKKQTRMGTLTLRGQRMAISLANEDPDEESAKLVNDDRILESCSRFAAGLPAAVPAAAAAAIPAAVAASRPLHRQLALITGDRGMNIKANARSIPVRTIKSFTKWANLP